MNELISVIVPVYNSAKYLDECVISIINQTYKNIEIILINDGSTDCSGEICEKYREKYSNIVIVNKENEGVSSARNTGLDIAKGKYIAFCDSDDSLEKTYLKFLYKNMIDTDADLSCCSWHRLGTNSELDDNYTENKIIFGDERYSYILMKDRYGGYPWNKLFKSSIINSDGKIRFCNDIAIYEDQLFVFEYIKKSQNICFFDEKLYAYRDTPNSALKQDISEKKLTAILGREAVYKIIKTEVKDETIKSFVWNNMMKTYIIYYKKLLFSRMFNKKKWINYIRVNFKLYCSEYKLNNSWGRRNKLFFLLLYYWYKLNE